MDDAAFKKLFSHPRMIEFLIRRHVPEWDGKIAYSTLERLPAELIDERLRRRYPDMMWRARTIDRTTDLVLLLELQGRPERHMVLRTTTYNVLAVQELIEHDKQLQRGERQLAVESLVLHHGTGNGTLRPACATCFGTPPRIPTVWWSACRPMLRHRDLWTCRR